MGFKLLKLLLFVMWIGAVVNEAYAQAPGILLPGQVEKQFQKVPESRSDFGRFQFPQRKQKPVDKADQVRFELRRLTVLGSTIYSDEDLLPLYQDKLNQQVSLLDIYAIADRITAKYRNDGYILSQAMVPAQTIEGGEIQLQVVEGYISDVRFSEETPGFRDILEDYGEKIRQNKPLTAEVLERYLLLMNDLPGGYARATLIPSKTEQAAAELLITFAQSAFSGGASVDNRGAESLGPWRYSADFDSNSLLGLQEKFSFRGVTSGDDELNFLAASHEQQIGSEGVKVVLGFSYVQSNPRQLGLTIVPLDLQTESYAGSAGLTYPLIRSRSENLYLRGLFTLNNSATKLFGVTDTEDNIRAFRIGLTYDLADRWRGISIVDAELSQGLNVFGGSSNGSFLLSRPQGQVDFSKVALYAARLQSLWAPYWSLLTAVNAQYAFSDLLSPELFSFGGEQFGRGYDPSELVGDSGVAFKTELRFTDNPQWLLLNSYTAYGFYDYGVVSQRSPIGGDRSQSASSVGLGIRTNFGHNVSAYVELAQPLTRIVAIEGNRHPRGYIGFSIRF